MYRFPQSHISALVQSAFAALITCQSRTSAPLLLQRPHDLHWDVVLKEEGNKVSYYRWRTPSRENWKASGRCLPVGSTTGWQWRGQQWWGWWVRWRGTWIFATRWTSWSYRGWWTRRTRSQGALRWYKIYIHIIDGIGHRIATCLLDSSNNIFLKWRTWEGPVLGSCWVHPGLFLQVSHLRAFHLQSPVSSPLCPTRWSCETRKMEKTGQPGQILLSLHKLQQN